jgi:single-strand DNA-binding protein
MFYNKLIMVGNLTREIELKQFPNGDMFAVCSLASTYKYKSSTGEQKDEVCFIDFKLNGRDAENAKKYLKKGSKVLLEGRLVFEEWTDRTTNQMRSRHTLRVEVIRYLDSKDSNN